MEDLTERAADIAVRHVRPEHPDLIARHLGDFRASLYAASDYLERAGRPRTLSGISRLDFIANSEPDRQLQRLHDMGIPVRSERFVISNANGAVAWEHVKAGYGVALLPEALGHADRSVEKVSNDFPSLEFPVWLVTHRELHTSRRIRIVFDTLARGIGGRLRRQSRNE